tara:strand:- start:92 stop:463 length:372 start_codon:yes stop_codon:yes gene_type:complete
MTKNNKIVAESLKNSGLKQKEFAERLGISRSHLSMIVAGSGKASDQLANLVKLKFSRTGVDNPVAPSEHTGRDEEMDILKDKLILQMELCQHLQSTIIERDAIISSLKDQLLGKQRASAKTGA